MKKLTKVNTETEFQPKDIFKVVPKYARIFGRVGNIFMTLIASNFYRSHIQSQLHDFADNSLVSIGKFVISYGKSKTWDEWATYFEHKDLDTLSFRETGIFFMLCTRMQQSLLDKVSDLSFSWGDIDSEEKAFHLRSTLEIQKYLYENSRRSVYQKVVYYIDILRLCNEFWINFFHVANDYDELCYKYTQIILNANYKYVENNILGCEIEEKRIIRLTEEDYQALTESLPITTFDEELIADIDWYKNLIDTGVDSKTNRLESELEKIDIKTFVADLDSDELEILKSEYTFDNDPELLIYLQRKPGILALLKDACPNFVRYFNSQSLSLGIWNDIDSSNLKYLTITIHVSEDIDDSLLDLNEFRGSYWFTLPWSLTRDIIIGFDY